MARLIPEVPVLAAVKEPVADGVPFPLFPGLGGPASLELRPLDQADVAPLLDGIDPVLDDLPVRFGPVTRQFAERGDPVPREPGAMSLSPGEAPCEHDLESPLADRDAGNHIFWREEFLCLADKAVSSVDLPVQFLLQG